ncbi:MAG: hypothetical protein V5A28_07890 [Haloarculaceae archaeon]
MNYPPSLLHRRARDADGVTPDVPGVTDESLVLRNYDGAPVRVHVRFVDADDETAFDRTYALGPGDVVSTPTRLRRGVYRVVATLDGGPGQTGDAGGTAERDAAECLVGSAPAETAVVETGNGVVSVTEGVI